jgi:hypothetical protein
MLDRIRYGPYLIALNGSEEESFQYDVPSDMQGKQARVLLDGEPVGYGTVGQVTLGDRRTIKPFSSFVAVLQE